MSQPISPLDAPELNLADLRSKLARLASHDHTELLTIYGRGCGGERVEVEGAAYQVHEVGSELELRALVPSLAEPLERRLAFVVPWTEKLPPDLAGEFSREGRPYKIGFSERLVRALGAHSASLEVERSALAPYLVAHHGNDSFERVSGTLGLRQLWERFLASAWNVELSGGLALDSLLAWAVRDGRGPALAQELAQRQAEPVRQELLALLSQAPGPLAATIWQAWERGEAQRLLEHALLFEVVAGSDDRGVLVWLKMVAAPALGLPVDEGLEGLVKQLGGLVAPTLRLLRRGPEGASRVRAVIAGAEALLGDLQQELGRHVERSVWLPSAARRLLDRLGEQLSAFAGKPTRSHFEAARATFEQLERHRAFEEEHERRRLRRAEMALRLSAWLCAPTHDAYAGGQSSYADAEALGRWYTEDGGYVDWARRAARGPSTDAFGQGVQAVVACVDELRRALDLRFARALARWAEAGRPRADVLPIEQAVQRIGEPFLTENPERRLLVLLMDGMAWAQAVQLLEGLAKSAWGPLRWPWQGPAGAKGGKGRGGAAALYPPVVAALPTVTDVSRAAFFAGARVPSGKATRPTSDDPDRWNASPLAKRFDNKPCLLLRGEGHNPDGSATNLALQRVADASQRIVAVVINAIDASLKGDAQEHNEWSPADIRSLRDLLDAAADAGRSVLLASDHGHVPGDCLTDTVSAPHSGGARWRPLLSDQEAINPEFEVRVAASQAWAPPGAEAIALLADDRHRYNPQRHAGEHGGATLAEVMAPCVLLGAEPSESPALEEDAGRAIRGPYVPEWWLYQLPPKPARRLSRRPSGRPATASLPAPTPQLELPHTAAPPPPLDAPEAGPRSAPAPLQPPEPLAVPTRAAGASTVSEAALALTEALLANAAFKAQLPSGPRRDRILRALQYLWDAGGTTAPARGLASAIDQPVHRMGGFVAQLRRVVNLDGFDVVRFDHRAEQVHFNRDLLVQTFGVKP